MALAFSAQTLQAAVFFLTKEDTGSPSPSLSTPSSSPLSILMNFVPGRRGAREEAFVLS